mgnify:CR=1 FL=1
MTNLEQNSSDESTTLASEKSVHKSFIFLLVSLIFKIILAIVMSILEIIGFVLKWIFYWLFGQAIMGLILLLFAGAIMLVAYLIT